MLDNKYSHYLKMILIFLILITNSSCDINEKRDKSLINTDSIIKSDSLRDWKNQHNEILDTSICQIILSDEKSVIENLGDLKNLINRENCECVTIFNANNTEYLQLHHESGGGSNSYDIFVVGYLRNVDFDSRFAKKTSIKFFKSENNIHLGLPEKEFLNIYAKVQFEIDVKGRIKKYSFHSVENTYLAEYTFDDGRLIEFRIGYDNS